MYDNVSEGRQARPSPQPAHLHTHPAQEHTHTNTRTHLQHVLKQPNDLLRLLPVVLEHAQVGLDGHLLWQGGKGPRPVATCILKHAAHDAILKALYVAAGEREGGRDGAVEEGRTHIP